ncbi:MAG: hypothetical protein ACXWWA_01420, partial [Chitinophagaceae bacterium]
ILMCLAVSSTFMFVNHETHTDRSCFADRRIGICLLQKEYSCENCGVSNKPPIADAGKDTIIILPMGRAKLGTNSSFQWTKISGSVSLTSKPISPV